MDAIEKGLANIARAQEEPVDANAAILGNFLEGFIPVDKFEQGVVVMTTNDIITALADMADLSQQDVNRVLATIGYHPGRNPAGTFGWLMKPISL